MLELRGRLEPLGVVARSSGGVVHESYMMEWVHHSTGIHHFMAYKGEQRRAGLVLLFTRQEPLSGPSIHNP